MWLDQIIPFYFYSTPSCPSCHLIAPPVSFPPLKQSLFNPHLMVPQKAPLSWLVLLQSYLFIGKPRGEHNRYWLPHRVKLQGIMSGGVRKEYILHPLLPRCCQNSFSCHYPIPFHPHHCSPHNSLISPPFLNCQLAFCPCSRCFLQIFISACEMYSRTQQQNRSSGISLTPQAAVSNSPFTFSPRLKRSRHSGVRFLAFMYFLVLLFPSFSFCLNPIYVIFFPLCSWNF